MVTVPDTGDTAAINLLRKARYAILEGGFDDLATVATELAGLIREQNPALKDTPVSPLVKPLIAIADILATDANYLRAAISAYVDAAQYSLGKDEELNKQSVIALVKKAERLPSAEDRITTYAQALLYAPVGSQISTLAKHKAKEQEDPVFFRMRAPRELPRLEEAVFESDLKAVFTFGIKRVIRQQVSSGDILYSVVVPRGFSRGKLAQAGVLNAQKLRRVSAYADLDRIIVPTDMLPPDSRRDIDFLSRLMNYGIYVDATHGRVRDNSGIVIAYKFSEGSNMERLHYAGIDAQAITPQDGKITVPLQNIDFFADPALVGKWNWMPAGGGNLKTSVPEAERPMVLQSLRAHGIQPTENNAGAEKVDFIVVSRNDKGKLNALVHQHVLQERSRQILAFAESLPGFANSIAVAAYKDACSYLFGLQHRKK